MKPKILFITKDKGTFINKDLKFLNTCFKVNTLQLKDKNGLIVMIDIIRSFIWTLFNLKNSRAIITWFVDYHAFFPIFLGKIFRKKTIVIVGGYDATCIPEINYGVFCNKNFRCFSASYVYKNANFIMPVDKSLIQSINYYADINGNGYNVGIKSFVKKINGEIIINPTGYDSEKWKNETSHKKNGIVTIAGGSGLKRHKTFFLKGLDLFFEIAKILPEHAFYIIGTTKEKIAQYETDIPSNIFFLGIIPPNKLAGELSKYKIYMQLSLSEGLPNSLCEAMLCECVPIVSNVGGMPNAVGETGYILFKKDAILARDIIIKALDNTIINGSQARERIKKLFTEQNRESIFLNVLKSIV